MSFVLYKLTKKERSDLDQYIKYLSLKFAQIICQARMGQAIHLECQPNPTLRNFWFNVAITDLSDVNTETRRALDVSSGDSRSEDRSIVSNLPLCVEITLKTEEGYDMLLEVWTLTIIPELNSPAIRALHSVYGTFGNLLKSIIVVSRATPAYKLSRHTSETYRITHAISAGKQPNLSRLGEDYKKFRIGQTCTVFGTINMSVAYRTKMTISPMQTGRDATNIMLKSDHFLNDLSPKQHRYYNTRNNEKIDLDKPMRPGAFVDSNKLRQFSEENHILPETPPFSWLLKKTQADQDDISISSDEDKNAMDKVMPLRNNNHHKNSEPIDVVARTTVSNNSIVESSISSPRSLSDSRSLSKLLSKDDDPLLFKELHLPFATDSTPYSDLARFYRECFNAPPLSQERSLTVDTEYTLQTSDDATLREFDDRVEEDVDELTRQLDKFETSLGDYDTLVTSLCCTSEIDNNSNS